MGKAGIMIRVSVNGESVQFSSKLDIEPELWDTTNRKMIGTMSKLANGVPIEMVSKMSGHTNIITTQIHARLTHDKIGRGMQAWAGVESCFLMPVPKIGRSRILPEVDSVICMLGTGSRDTIPATRLCRRRRIGFSSVFHIMLSVP